MKVSLAHVKAAGVTGAVSQHAATQHTFSWFPVTTALAGAFGGWLLKTCTDWLTEKRRADKAFEAAALLVSDEIQANIVKLRIALDAREDPEPLVSQAYNTYQGILARRLPPEARDAVRGLYIHARVHRAFQVRNPAGAWVCSTHVVREALDKGCRARELLGQHIPKDAANI